MAHAERAHARLSASGSKRWLSCTPSARIEDQFPDSTSDYAAEGTLAHELSEIILKKAIGLITPSAYSKQFKKIEKNSLFNNEMVSYCQDYADSVIERYHEALATTPDATISLEERLDFSHLVPDGFGTGDVLIIADGTMEVIDLKYGKGVQVSAIDNSQMRLYGLGAINIHGHLYDISRVKMTIMQPRLNHIDSEELDAKELLEWGESYVRPRAELADRGEGEFIPGDHCKFCKAKAICTARAEQNLEMAKFDFKKGELLTFDEVAEILARADELQAWAKDIQEYALDQAERHGIKFPGWKLVAGRSNRKYADEDSIISKLTSEGYEEEVIYQPKKLKGITDMTKLLGTKVFETLIGSYVMKPPGKPVLVPESDSRPELSSTEDAIRDFE